MKKVTPRQAKEYDEAFESDVMPEMRFLVDTYTDSDEMSEGHRVMFFDIEVEVTDGFPEPSKAQNKVTSIAMYTKHDGKYRVYVLGDGKDNVKDEVDIRFYKTESELLKEFLRYWIDVKPTMITGWNTNGFDIPYLYNRISKVLGEEFANALSPIQIVKYNPNKKMYRIAGVSSLDYMDLYRKFTYTQQSSYRLDHIGTIEVGIGKVEYEGTLNDLYENDIDKFVQYNLQDVKLVKRIDEKLNFIEIGRGIAHLGHCPYEDVFMSSRYLEGAILVYLKKKGIVAPNKPPRPKTFGNEKFIGAYVQDPIKGKHEWVYDLDITSMYPSCIMSLNISPETKIGKIEGWKPEEFLKKDHKKTYSITQGDKVIGRFTEKELAKFLEGREVGVATNGVMYRTDKDGLLPALLRKWFEERVEYRKLSKKFHEEGDKEQSDYFDRRQYLQKVLLNSHLPPT